MITNKHMFYSEDPKCWRCGKYSKYHLISRATGTPLDQCDITKEKDYSHVDRSNIYENVFDIECISDKEVEERYGKRVLYQSKHPFGPWWEEKQCVCGDQKDNICRESINCVYK